MSRFRAFETAAARRRKDPIVWQVDGREIKLISSLELADLADLLDALQSEDGNDENSIRVAVAKRKVLIEIVGRFVEQDSKDNFISVANDLDIHILSQMVQELIQEYSGAANPTKPSSSSDGYLTTGESLTDGAQPETLTQSD